MGAVSGMVVAGVVVGDDEGGAAPTKPKSSVERCEPSERPKLDLRGEADPMAAVGHLVSSKCFNPAELPKVPDLTPAQADRVIESIPVDYRHAYAQAEAHGGRRRVTKEVLAGIGFMESDHGRKTPYGTPLMNEGPMQIRPDTASALGRGQADLEDIGDAADVAAEYLYRAGTAEGAQPYDVDRAVYAYDRSSAYVKSVETVVDVYAKAEQTLAAQHRNGPELTW